MTSLHERLMEVRRMINQITWNDPREVEVLHKLVNLIDDVDSKIEHHKLGGIYDHPELKS